MGWTPEQVGQASMWQYLAAIEGYAAANGAADGMTKAEEDELWDFINDD